MQPNNNQREFKVRINKFIRVPQIRVILSDGSNGDIMDTQDALKLAQDQGLDLIEINPKASPPVCRIADHGKLKYEEKKKQQIAKKNQQAQELKEITIRPNTDSGDLSHKLEKIKEFLQDGNRVKITVRFRGREMTHTNIGRDKIQWILSSLNDLIIPNPQINMEGKFMSTVLSPIKK